MEIVHGDVRDKDSLTSFFSHNPDTELIVIHTAAIVSISSKVDKKVVDVNVNGTKNIVELCLRHKVKKLVHTSSVHAIPEKSHGETITEVSEFDPKSVHGLYAKTKAAASQIVLKRSQTRIKCIYRSSFRHYWSRRLRSYSFNTIGYQLFKRYTDSMCQRRI